MSHRATTDEVIAYIEAERGNVAGSWPWTLRLVRLASAAPDPQWTMTSLTAAEALAIRLPPHSGEPCRGDRMALVEMPEGQAVSDVARTLMANARAYAEANPQCWGRIARAAREPFSTVVLSAAPVSGWPEHAGLVSSTGLYYHLDGFHRLVGWAFADRLTPDARVPAFVVRSASG